MLTSFGRSAGALLGLSLAVVAQMQWTQVGSTGPAGRSDHTMVYDVQRGRTVLFGGLAWDNSHGHFVYGDTWEWDGAHWTQANAPGPVARFTHAMVYDSLRGRTVMYGGDNISGDQSDTWAWNGTTWTLLDTNGPARHWHAMAYDPLRDRIVMFGGAGNYGATWYGDTWEWNGSSWWQVATTGPGIRIQPSVVYDAVRGKTLLFGGKDYATELGDTWEWDGSQWTQVATTGPVMRSRAAIAFDSLRGKAVLYGGLLGGFCFAETWEWDGSAWTWVAGNVPSGRAAAAMVYDSASGKSLMFGGYDNTTNPSTYHGETWEWAYRGSATTYGYGCGTPALDLAQVATARPTIHTTAQATLTNIPSGIAFVSLGWSRTVFEAQPLPISLVGYGMPWCNLLQSAENAAQPVAFTGPGTAVYSLSLPNWPGLIGLHVFLQAWATAPGANSGNAIVSNGLEWVIGGS